MQDLIYLKKTVVRTRKHSRLTCIDSRVGRMNGNPELQITKTVLQLQSDIRNSTMKKLTSIKSVRIQKLKLLFTTWLSKIKRRISHGRKKYIINSSIVSRLFSPCNCNTFGFVQHSFCLYTIQMTLSLYLISQCWSRGTMCHGTIITAI